MKVAFVANLDAECELMAPATYRPSSRMVASMRARAAPVQHALASTLGADVAVLVPGQRAEHTSAYDAVLCWCPTPAAVQLMREVGTSPLHVPALEILQRVNHRAFASALEPRLAGAHFVTDFATLTQILAQPRPPRGYLLKRPFGFAGRGRKHLAADVPFAGALATWAAASMHSYGGGLQVEPFVAVAADFGLHGLVQRDGATTLGVPTRQHVDAGGRWLASAVAGPGDLAAHEHAALFAAATRVAAALHVAGYFGPFGIDAYRYRDDAGNLAFHPLSEINARLSMGFVAGMGGRTRELVAAGPH